MKKLLRVIFPLFIIIILVSCSSGSENQLEIKYTPEVTPSAIEKVTSTIVPTSTFVSTSTSTPSPTVLHSSTPSSSPEPTLPLGPLRWDDPILLAEINAVLDEHPEEVVAMMSRDTSLGIGDELIEGNGKGLRRIYITLNGCSYLGMNELQLGDREKALISYFFYPYPKDKEFIVLPVLSGYQKNSNIGRVSFSDEANLTLEKRMNWSYDETKEFLQNKELFAPVMVTLQLTYNAQGEFDKNAFAYNMRLDQDYIWAPARFPNNEVIEYAVKKHVAADYSSAAGKLPDIDNEV